MRYTKIPSDTFQKLQMGAGILLRDFSPDDGSFEDSDIVGATSGGINFNAAPTFKDMGEDIDNCPANMMELKKLESVVATMAGSFLTVDTAACKSLVAAADVSGNKITPRNDLKKADFADVWLVADYSDENGENNGGFIAIRMMNALSTGGFQLQTTSKEKGKMSFTYTAHYSMAKQDTVPFEIYIKTGTAEG